MPSDDQVGGCTRLADCGRRPARAGPGRAHLCDARRHLRELDPEQVDRSRRALADRFHHPGDGLAHNRHHLEVVADNAEFGVERRVLGQMAGGVVRLRRRRTRLVDALGDADHRLLLELRALRKKCAPTEVVEREDVGSALRRRGDHLRLEISVNPIRSSAAPKPWSEAAATLLPWSSGFHETPVTATRLLARNSDAASLIIAIETSSFHSGADIQLLAHALSPRWKPSGERSRSPIAQSNATWTAQASAPAT